VLPLRGLRRAGQHAAPEPQQLRAPSRHPTGGHRV
jgi:hypothetical protein